MFVGLSMNIELCHYGERYLLNVVIDEDFYEDCGEIRSLVTPRVMAVTQIDDNGDIVVLGKNSDDSFDWCEANGITNDDVMRAVHSRKMF